MWGELQALSAVSSVLNTFQCFYLFTETGYVVSFWGNSNQNENISVSLINKLPTLWIFITKSECFSLKCNPHFNCCHDFLKLTPRTVGYAFRRDSQSLLQLNWRSFSLYSRSLNELQPLNKNIDYFGIEETWELVSVHWQQIKDQLSDHERIASCAGCTDIRCRFCSFNDGHHDNMSYLLT